VKSRVLLGAAGGFLLLGALALFYFQGWWIPNYPDARDYPVQGIDVSSHQGHIDWKRVAGSGVRFVYLKATEGGDFQDKAFAENLRGAREAGLICGAYHFFRLGTPGREQALNFIRTVPGGEVTLPPAIDLEFWGNSSARPTLSAFQTELSIFTGTLAKSDGNAPVLYLGSDFANVYFPDPPSDSQWIRDVILNPGWYGNKAWFIWQFSERGRVPGIDSFVDLDVFNGGADKFDHLGNRPN
jgi:lysozyme